MRDRWQKVSRLWEAHKKPVNRLSLLGRLDFHHELSAQLEWRQFTGDRPVRVVYSGWGTPTAAILHDDEAIVDYKLFWIACKDTQEAHYLLAIVNSDVLAEDVNKYTTPNWAGKTRDLQKHLWKLPIPEFDPANPLHAEVSDAGKAAAKDAARQLAALQAERDRVTVTIARRELRKWLRNSPEGRSVEQIVTRLLRG